MNVISVASVIAILLIIITIHLYCTKTVYTIKCSIERAKDKKKKTVVFKDKNINVRSMKRQGTDIGSS